MNWGNDIIVIIGDITDVMVIIATLSYIYIYMLNNNSTFINLFKLIYAVIAKAEYVKLL